MSKKQQYCLGLRTGLPVILGFVPVGIAYAIMAGQAGLTVAETIQMSVFVFAGASQMMAVGMLAQGAGVVAILLATFILNLRHLIMSTCAVNRMKRTTTGFRLLAMFGVTDESFAIYTTMEEENCSVWFFLGLITVTYSSWVAGTTIGAFASGILPQLVTDSLGIALYAMFIALLIPNVKHNFRLGLLVVMTALVNMGLQQVMASSWALIVATLVCAALGAFLVDEKAEEAKQ